MADIKYHRNTEAKTAQGLFSFLEGTIWISFIFCLSALIYNLPDSSSYTIQSLLSLNTFTLLIWSTITFFGGIVYRFSFYYMKGFDNLHSYAWYIFGVTISVMLFVAAEHFVLLNLSWLGMGYCMAKLIGCVTDWKEAGVASRITLRYFWGSTLLLGISLITMWYQTGFATVSGVIDNVDKMSQSGLLIAGTGMLLAGIIQASIFPFHRWLLSAMTAPTPSSALLHAGFVNAAAILFARFAPVLVTGEMLLTIFLAGAAGTILAQFWKLVQVYLKQRLASSTAAQMGFMIMQCGLGFFNAAVAHLMLHGFYKAYLFFSSGSRIKRKTPDSSQATELPISQMVVILFSGLAGGALFAWLTGKGTAIDSGLFLTFIVVLTVIHGAIHLLQQKAIPIYRRLVFLPLFIIPSIALYALIYNFITLAMRPLPMAATPAGLTIWHLAIGLIFLLAYIFMESGMYRKFPKLYVWLINITQPHRKTVLGFKKHLI